MKYMSLLALFLTAGCISDPVAAIHLDAESTAYCNYVGATHGSDGYGGLGPRAACIRYVRDTGHLPPS